MADSHTDVSEEELIADPKAHFAAPKDVLDANLTRETKRRVLESWELDARRLEESASENMAGGEPSLLSAVSDARRRLETVHDEGHVDTTHETESFGGHQR